MKNAYPRSSFRWFLFVGLLGMGVSSRAQPPAPVIQWQRLLESNGLTASSVILAEKASKGGYGILAGKTLALFSLTGEPVWTQPIPGSYADSSTTRISLRKALALAPTPDGGFAVLGLDLANRYYLVKLDSAGTQAWAKTLARADTMPIGQITQDALSVSPEGDLVVVGSYTDVLSYLTVTKLNAAGIIAGQWRTKISGPSPLTVPQIHQIVATSNSSSLLIGQATDRQSGQSSGLAIRLDDQYAITWQRTYTGMTDLQQAVASPDAAGSYTAIGTGSNQIRQAITLAPNQTSDGTLLTELTPYPHLVSMVRDESGNLTILDALTDRNGDFRLLSGRLPANLRWTKNYGGSGQDAPTALLASEDGGFLAVGTTTSTDGDVAGKSAPGVAAWVIKLGGSVQSTTLRLLAPTYDCQTGFIRFQTQGGDGSTIVFTAPGVTRAQLTDDAGTVEAELRRDPKVILLQATQSNQTVSYEFDLKAACPAAPTAPSADSLRLLPPTYNCQTGALTFYTSGGDGSPIEFAAAGVTSWTTEPHQFVDQELRTAYDAQPLTLMARQHGRVVTYVFNIKAACGRARTGVTDTSEAVTVSILGNPVLETALFQIKGAGGQSVTLGLIDANGRLIEQRQVEQAGPVEKQAFDLRQQLSGALFLHTTVQGKTQTLKFVKY